MSRPANNIGRRPPCKNRRPQLSSSRGCVCVRFTTVVMFLRWNSRFDSPAFAVSISISNTGVGGFIHIQFLPGRPQGEPAAFFIFQSPHGETAFRRSFCFDVRFTDSANVPRRQAKPPSDHIPCGFVLCRIAAGRPIHPLFLGEATSRKAVPASATGRTSTCTAEPQPR